MKQQTAREYIVGLAQKSKSVAHEAAIQGTDRKNQALEEMAKALEANVSRIVEENSKDVAYAKNAGKTEALIDRLILNEKKILAMASAIRDIIALPDPVGSGNYTIKRPNGLQIHRVRVPIGVVAMVYESRPNVTSDAAALTLKSGNTVILRGGKESIHSNTIIGNLIRGALKKADYPVDAVQVIERTDHEVVDEMLLLNEYIDLVIPRGGESLIQSVVQKSRIPVIRHDRGLCHVYVDETGDKNKAETIVINAKCQRPSACNSIETLLVHESYPYIKEMIAELQRNKTEIVADDAVRKIDAGLKPATEEDWSAEYLDNKISVKIVKSVEEAVEHINRYGSHHSDSIVGENYHNVQYFLEHVDSATVYANASTRFTDGAEFGLGAEVGISTQKFHVRGPMGLESLTTEKWLIYGDGQVRK